jgi:hypothetical protein
MILVRTLIVLALFTTAISGGLAQWTKTIDCPPGRVYIDIRKDAGRSEYCNHILPGSLEVKDGPSRFWFNSNLEGEVGKYNEGRKIGKWKECSRFGNCEQKNYPELDPDELQRPSIKPSIPIQYTQGKYVFDFASCRRTQITYTEGGEPALELNINPGPDGCLYAYATEDEIEHGMETRDLGHLCIVPFRVGTRAFDSLDLMSELSKVGLPQYCKHDILVTGPAVVGVKLHNRESSAQIFTAEYDTGNNGTGIAQARLHFQKNAASRSDRCVVRYDPASKGFYLLSDRPGKYLGPIAAGSNDSLWNNECLLSGCSNGQLSGTTLTVQFAIRFNPVQFAGKHGMYIELVDTQRHSEPAGVVGVWTVPSEEAEPPGTVWPSNRTCPSAATPAQ